MAAINRTRRTTSSRSRVFASLAAIAAVSCLTGRAWAQPNVDGVWGPLTSWPLITVHAVMTPQGRVLTFGTKADGTQTGYFIYDVWDPSAGLGGGHLTLPNTTQTDIFCASQVIMPDNGEILIAGGDVWTGTGTTNTGNHNTSIFNPLDNSLTPGVDLNRERWYSSSTVLVNGEIYIQGGNGGYDRPEIHRLNGTNQLLTSADTTGFDALFPRNYLAPDGRIFGYDGSGRMYYVDTTGSGSVSNQGQFSSSNAGYGASAAMFRPGKILQFGGNSNGAIVIDINGPQPVVTPTASMSSQRYWVNGTVLPDGKVLATGGSRVDNQLTGVNNSAEIWDPATGTWHVGTSGAVARLYHSNATLLQDGTVLVSGGGAPGPLNNTNAEIYSPPYLFTSTGALATRPQILSAQSSYDVGSTMAIQVDVGNISRVTLVKTGATTHSNNMDQRFVELPFTQAGNTVSATLPSRATDTPPGIYHLFVLDAAGTPSKSKLIQINIASNPNIGVDYTATMGGTGGSAYNLSCGASEVLVGVYGKYGATAINQVGPECVPMDQFGHWIGNPVQRALTGTTSSGTAFERQCPRDNAMSGFQGQYSSTVGQIQIECRSLTSIGGLTGPGTLLGSAGTGTGTVQPLLTCSTGNPVYALYGSSGTTVNSFGALCRPGVITTVSGGGAPVVVNPGDQTNTTGQAIDLAIQATDPENDLLIYSASGLPVGLQINATTGHIAGTLTTPGTTQTTVSVSDGAHVTQVSFTWTVTGNALLTVAPMPPQPSRVAGTAVTYTASATGGSNVVYKWQFGDGTPETAYSSSPSVTHTFALPGLYFVTLTVTDDLAVPSIQQFLQTIHLPLTATQPRNSGSIAYETRSGANSRVWLVNQDNDSVTAFDAVTNTRLSEVPVGSAPRSVAIAPDGRIWVANRDSATISVISPASLTVVQTVSLPWASQPYGIVFSNAANQAFVALAAVGRVVKLDASTGAQLASLDVGPNPRQLAIDSTSTNLYVSRFITRPQPGEETAVVQTQIGGVNTGGEVLVIDTATLTLASTVVLQHSTKPDAENQGSGVPNYLGAPVVSPDGTIATVPSKQDNIGRGTLRSGVNLNFQNTVRAISSRIDLTTGAEDYAHRIDHDNSGVASAVAYGPNSVYMFVALETSREVAVVDAYKGSELFRFPAGRAPQGLVVSPNGQRLYVNNFMDRTLGVFDLGQLMSTGQWNVPQLATLPSVATEKLSGAVLAGKQIFYDAKDTRIARDAYISCASCHNDGGQDGRVWDFTGMGEGLRNTINLRGGPTSSLGRLHWTGNFDEVQDFEGQIRSLGGGTGLMSDTDFNTGTRSQPLGDPKAGVSPDLDALAAYVGSLGAFAPSPYRGAGGALTADAAAGKTVFDNVGCTSCHSGTSFTNSNTNTLEDVGTIKQPTSGQRLGQPLTGLDTPTLCSVWQTAPYLHDGSAPTIAAAVSAHSAFSLSATELTQVAAYLQQLDATTAPDCAPIIQYAPLGFAHSGSAVGDSSGTSLSVQLTGVKAGSLIVAYVKWEGTSTTVTFGDGTSTFTGDTQNNAGNGDLHGAFYYLPASSVSGTVTYTATWSAGRPFRRLMVYEYSYGGGTVALDASNRATGTSGSLDSGNVTTTGTDEVAFGAYGEYDSFATYTESIGGAAADQVVRAGYSAMWSKSFTAPFTGAATADGNSATWLGNVVAFKHVAGVPNTAPTISNISDRSTLEDTGTGAIAFTVGDAETAAGSLTVTGTSSNQSVVANSGIVFGGSGANRTVSLTPVANANGTTTLTVMVSDGVATASDTFVLTVTPVNDPPTISSVANQTAAGGSTLGPLAVTVGDIETPAASLTLSAISSDPVLVPVANIVFGGSGANRTVSVTPASGSTGAAVITLVVSDGTTTTATNFTLTVTATNTPPTISTIANQSTAEDTPTVAIPFTVGDAETAPGSLTVSGTSSNQSVVANGGIAFGGSGANRTVTLTPVANANGTSTITVTVSDSVATATASFVLTVTPVNDPPTITSIANQTTSIGVPVGPLAFTVGDVETAAGSLTMTGSSSNTALVPNAGIVFGGTGANRTVTVTPAAGATGTATITLSASDGAASTPTSFALTVLSTPPAPLAFAHNAAALSDANGTTLSAQMTGVKTGSLIVAYVKWEGTPASTVTLSDGASTFTADAVNTAANNDLNGRYYYALSSAASGTVTYTATWSAGRPFRKLMVYEYSYSGGAVAFDASNHATATSGTLNSGNITTTGNDEIAFGAYGEYNSTTTNTERIGGIAADQVLRAGYASMWSKSFTASFTGAATASGNSATWIGNVIAFKHVTAPNTPPTISNIADLSTAEDTPTSPIGFTVGDAETAAGSLSVTATSSNQSVVANSGIVLGGSGANRTVTLAPVANANGTATITVTVSDGAATATDTFVLTVTPVNDPPTISSVANQTTSAGVAVGPLPVTVGDAETAAGSLTLTGSSSDTVLVPNANIVLGGTGANRTVTITPAVGSTGAAQITLTVSDGVASATASFTLTVTAANTPPTISNIADLSTAEDTPTSPIGFTVGDAETAAGSLSVTATSSNQSVVANSGIVLGGSGANRTVTLAPVANANGTATITVTVSDGAATATDTFVLTVTPVNDPPTISSVANQTTSIGTAVGPLPVTLADVETAAGSLTLTGSSSNTALVPNANIVFGGTGAARTVTVTPAAGASGTTDITLTVGDGSATASTSFTLTVSAIPPAPLTFAHSGGAFADASGTSLTVQLTSVQAGSLIVAYVKWEGTPASTVTLSDGTSTFTADAIDTAANNDLNGRFYYLPSSSKSGTVTYTATWSAARPFRKLLVFEYSYGGGSVSFDGSSRATATSGALNSGNITTTGTDEVVFGAYGEYNSNNTSNELINNVAADQVQRANYTSMWSKKFTSTFTGAATAAGNSTTWIGSTIAFKHTTP